ncbi:MAG TPA: M24 family metallopeptidase [Chloroflexota bacterium]|nr:M24 family metallopeptidase [Chloroflexota bacterium]
MSIAVSTVLPKLSVGERDRRYGRIRELLRERGVDCAIATGTNLFYLTNGISGQRTGLLPAVDEPLLVAVNGRHLADLPAEVIVQSQDWVSDVRPGNDASPLIDRLRELKLENGAIGLADANVPHNLYAQLAKALPDARLIDVSDVFVNVRTIKSDEEVDMIEQANRVFDAGIQGMYQHVRPGMTGAQASQEMVKAMWQAGGDLDSMISVNFGAVPKQNPVLADLCLDRAIQWGDVATLTAHAEYGHYAGHSDQEIVFGEATPLHREMFEAGIEVRQAVLKHLKPGSTQRDLIDAYRQACQQTKFKASPHSQIHQYGIDVPEFAGPAFRVADTGSEGRLGSAGNFRLEAGMVYSISPTIVAPNGEDTILGGTSLVVTETGYRNLGDREVEMLVVR